MNMSRDCKQLDHKVSDVLPPAVTQRQISLLKKQLRGLDNKPFALLSVCVIIHSAIEVKGYQLVIHV